MINRAHSPLNATLAGLPSPGLTPYKGINYQVYLEEEGVVLLSFKVNPFIKETFHPNNHLVLPCPKDWHKSKQIFITEVALRLPPANASCLQLETLTLVIIFPSNLSRRT